MRESLMAPGPLTCNEEWKSVYLPAAATGNMCQNHVTKIP
jgi:hypothetical protein